MKTFDYFLQHEAMEKIKEKWGDLKSDLAHKLSIENQKKLEETGEWCCMVLQQYPMVYSTLELGKSWSDVMRKWLEIPQKCL